MAFGHKAAPSKIYSFHAREPVENLQTVSDHIFRAHRYRNALVELELKRREKSEEAVRRADPAIVPIDRRIAVLEERLEQSRAAIRREASENRSRKEVAEESRIAFDVILEDLRGQRQQRDELRKAAYASEGAKEELAQIDEWWRSQQHELRAGVEVHWGSYLSVEDGASDFRKGAPPKFRRWVREGKIAVQIQKGITWEEACGEKSAHQGQFHVEVLPERYRQESQRGEIVLATPTSPPKGPQSPDPGSKRQQRCPYRNCLFWIRIGTVSGTRRPIWAKVPVVVHRPIPPDAKIKWVYLHRRRRACHDVWSVDLFLARDAWEERPRGEGVCGIDVGWRLLEDGSLRVACLVDGDGREEELRIPAERIESLWRKPDEIRSQRDRAFKGKDPAQGNGTCDNVEMARLMGWLDTTGIDLPEWLCLRRHHMHAWRSQAQLAGLILQWRDNRFRGDGEILEGLERWRRDDRKLYEEEANLRRKAVAWRLDFYRCWANGIRRRFGQVAIEDCDWRRLLRRPEAEDGGEEVNETARYLSRVASPGLLREVLIELAGAEKTAAEWTTRTCHACGVIFDADYASCIEVDCPHCGSRHDQDMNAARNLRDALCESVGG